MSVASWYDTLNRELYEYVLPFWLTHSLDRKHGGYYTNLSENGTTFDTDKYVWLLGRQVWLLSKLANMTSPTILAQNAACSFEHQELIDAAKLGNDFILQYIEQPDGTYAFAVDEQGAIQKQQRKIFSACFCCQGYHELGKALSDPTLVDKANQVFQQILIWKADPTALGRPNVGRPMHALNQPMILLNLMDELQLVDDKQEQQLIAEIKMHYYPEGGILVEHVDPSGKFLDHPEGRLFCPGHTIEAGWFLLTYAQKHHDTALKQFAIQLIETSFTQGWDTEYGGLYYFLDCKGYDPVQLEWNMKLWWPHCEAMIALLMCYVETKQDKYWTMFDQVATYAMKHFSDHQYGEWYGYLDRQGNKTHSFKAGPYKGCFHVPRALMLCLELLRALH